MKLVRNFRSCASRTSYTN